MKENQPHGRFSSVRGLVRLIEWIQQDDSIRQNRFFLSTWYDTIQDINDLVRYLHIIENDDTAKMKTIIKKWFLIPRYSSEIDYQRIEVDYEQLLCDVDNLGKMFESKMYQ